MDGNNAKKVPILDRLMGVSIEANGTLATPQNNLERSKPASPNGLNSVENQPELNVAQPVDTPKNRRTDKSLFEIELTQIVNRIMTRHIFAASEGIVKEVLHEVRSRLPGQRKS